jgi:hypothetical protein
MFTQIMWFYVMGPSVSNKKLCDLWSKNWTNALINMRTENTHRK